MKNAPPVGAHRRGREAKPKQQTERKGSPVIIWQQRRKGKKNVNNKNRIDPFGGLLRYYHISGTELADILGCCPATARKKLKTPEDLTVREIRMISKKGRIPIDELRGAI